MLSKTQKPLEEEKIKEIIKDSFGENTKIGKIVELTDGWFSTAYSIELINEKKEIVMKISPPLEVDILTYEKDIMKTEVTVYNLLKQKTDVPIPKILGSDFSHSLINRDYFFMNKMKGKMWSKIKSKLTKEQNESLKCNWGKYTAQINSIIGDHFGYFTDSKKTYNTNWKSTFLNMIKNVLDDGIRLKAKLPKKPQEIQKIINDKSHVLDEVIKPQLVHWDLWGGNTFLIVNNGSFSIEGITDCERALWGDPLMEYIFMDIDKEKEFIRGYEEISKKKFLLTNEMRCRRLMYNVYLFLIRVTENNSRCYSGLKFKVIMKWANSSLKKNLRELKKFKL